MTGSDRVVVTFPEHVLVQAVGTGEAVILNLEDESYYGLNEVAARMVELLTSSTSIDSAVDALASEYEADATTLRRDMEELLDALRSRGLVVVE